MRLSTKSLLSPSAKSLAVGVVIALGVLAFAITGISPNQGGMDTNMAAQVGSQTVTMIELQRVVENLNRQTGNETGRREANIQSGLNQLIQEKVFLEEATRIGWIPSDAEVAQWIRKRPEFQNEKTKQFDISLYRKFLKSGYVSELEFHKQGRDALMLEKMSALLYLPEVTPRPVLTEKSVRDSTEFNLEFAQVQPNPQKFKEKLSAEAQKYAGDAANEKSLKDAFEASKNEFIRPAQVRVLSILVAHKDAQRAEGDAKNRSKDDALKLISDIRAKIVSGESFSNIAGSTNDDATAKLSKGEIGWVDTTNIDPVTSGAAFALNKDKALSDVLDTPFGFRLLKWQESRERLERKFEDVKVELAERALNEKIKTEMSAGIEQELNKLLSEKKWAEVNTVAQNNGFEWKVVKKPVTPRTRFIEDLGQSEPLLPVLFSLKNKGDMSSQILDFSGRKTIVRLAGRKEGITPDAERLKRLQSADQRLAGQTYVSLMQRKLFDLSLIHI
jgi:peptidyl-prolyl cis-trans isomerase D